MGRAVAHQVRFRGHRGVNVPSRSLVLSILLVSCAPEPVTVRLTVETDTATLDRWCIANVARDDLYGEDVLEVGWTFDRSVARQRQVVCRGTLDRTTRVVTPTVTIRRQGRFEPGETIRAEALDVRSGEPHTLWLATESGPDGAAETSVEWEPYARADQTVYLRTEFDRCDNGEDDDRDGRTDQDDPECERCGDLEDNDADGLVDCDDKDCGSDPQCDVAPDTEVCDDRGKDEDGDGFADCEDTDCADDPSCAGTTTTTTGPPIEGCDPDVVIAGVYTQGGVGYGDWANDFVELANRTSADVDLTGLALHVAGPDHAWRVIDLAGHTIPADGYFQVALGSSYAFPNRLLPSPDLQQPAPRTDLSSTGSAVVLASTLVPAGTGGCLTADVVDAVGLYGAGFCPEGYAILQGVVTGEGFRRTDVCVDTDANATDFGVASMQAPLDSSDSHGGCTCP